MTKKKYRGPPLREETLAVRVSPAVAAEVRAAAECEEVRVSDWLREAIRFALASVPER
jgi:predicted HicB family RNase H-like nuclease